jgi:branched-chain amino acid transport system substrate-binding protein
MSLLNNSVKNMKNKNKISVVIIVILLAWISAGLSKPNSSKAIKIGVISVLSGENSDIGQNFANGIKLAADQYQKDHPEVKLELVTEDDGYDPKKGVSIYKKLTSIDNVDAIINMSSPTVDAVHEGVNVWNKPFIQLGEEAVHKDDNIFEVFPGQKSALVSVGEQARKDGYKKITIVTQQIAAYERFIDGFQEGFKGEVNIVRISPTEKDMKAFALKVASEKPDAVAIFMGSPATAEFLKALHDQGRISPQLYFDTGLQFGLSDLKNALGGDLSLIEGAKGAFIISDTRQDFKDAYKEKYGKDSGMLSDHGYDAFMFLMSSYQKNGSDWVKSLKTQTINGASGLIKLDQDGDRLPDFKVITVISGELR